MRVITGKWKGMKLQSPPGRLTRPTPDRVKESVFSVVGSSVVDTMFLDLFAGSGSIGLEALSRGARYVVFVESSKIVIRVLEKNVMRLGAGECCKVIHADSLKSHAMFKKNRVCFDLVYMDPPFFRENYLDTLKSYFFDPVISEKGLIVLEHFHKVEPPVVFGKFSRTRLMGYGDTCLSLYGLTASK